MNKAFRDQGEYKEYINVKDGFVVKVRNRQPLRKKTYGKVFS